MGIELRAEQGQHVGQRQADRAGRQMACGVAAGAEGNRSRTLGGRPSAVAKGPGRVGEGAPGGRRAAAGAEGNRSRTLGERSGAVAKGPGRVRDGAPCGSRAAAGVLLQDVVDGTPGGAGGAAARALPGGGIAAPVGTRRRKLLVPQRHEFVVPPEKEPADQDVEQADHDQKQIPARRTPAGCCRGHAHGSAPARQRRQHGVEQNLQQCQTDHGRRELARQLALRRRPCTDQRAPVPVQRPDRDRYQHREGSLEGGVHRPCRNPQVGGRRRHRQQSAHPRVLQHRLDLARQASSVVQRQPPCRRAQDQIHRPLAG